MPNVCLAEPVEISLRAIWQSNVHSTINFCPEQPGSQNLPRQGRQARFGPSLDFRFQYALIRNNWSKKFGVEYWTLPGSNLLWRPWEGIKCCKAEEQLRAYRPNIYTVI